MKKFQVILSLPLIALMAVATSCSDDDEPQNKTEILTSKTWAITSVSVKTNGKESDATDLFLSECGKDNRLTFTKAGVYSMDAGANTCEGDEEDETGTWSWNSNETVLTIKPAGDDQQDMEIISMSNSTIKATTGTETFDSDGDGKDDTTASIIFTLTAK